jgi:hypothetical protein
MNKKLQESSMNAGTPGKEQSNSQLIERKTIEGFFTGVKLENQDWFIALGNYKVTNAVFETFEEAESYISNMSIDWAFLTTIINVVVENSKNQTL